MKILLMLLLLPLAGHGTIVTTTTDKDDGSLGSGISLREAVKYSPPGDTVTFAPALSGQIIRLGLGEILINQSVTIDGSALLSPIKLSGDKTGNGKTTDDNPVLRLTAGSLVLRSLILSDANCGESSGCITIRPSAPFDLLVDRCTLSGNSGYLRFDQENAVFARLGLARQIQADIVVRREKPPHQRSFPRLPGPRQHHDRPSPSTVQNHGFDQSFNPHRANRRSLSNNLQAALKKLSNST
jgi:hypothetical protein